MNDQDKERLRVLEQDRRRIWEEIGYTEFRLYTLIEKYESIMAEQIKVGKK